VILRRRDGLAAHRDPIDEPRRIARVTPALDRERQSVGPVPRFDRRLQHPCASLPHRERVSSGGGNLKVLMLRLVAPTKS
jgi:hypothetical protein